jgi:hypothetical protein
MHPHAFAVAVGPLDHTFHLRLSHATGPKLDEVGHVPTGTNVSPPLEVLPQRIVLQARGAGGLVESVLARQKHGFLPEFFGLAGTFVTLSASPAIQLARRSGQRGGNVRGLSVAHQLFSKK